MDKNLQINHSSLLSSHIICINGCCNYLGSYLIPYLLDQGYKLRCILYKPKDSSSSSLTFQSYRDYFISLLSKYNKILSLFYIDDIYKANEIYKTVLRGCKYIYHIPHAYYSQESNNNIISTYFDPIIQLSLQFYKCILNEAQRQYKNSNSNIIRIIFIGSCHSVNNKDSLSLNYNENDWNNDNNTKDPLIMGKTLAEKALWEFYNSEDAKHVNLQVYSLLFPFILGPIKSPYKCSLDNEYHMNSNNSLILDLLSGYHFPCLPLFIHIIDIRDVINVCFCLLNSKSKCDRYLITSESLWIVEISRLLADNYPYESIATSTMSELRASIFMNFGKSSVSKSFRSYSMNKSIIYSQDKMKNILEFYPKYNIQETILDTAQSLIENDYLTIEKKQLLLKSSKRKLYTGISMISLFIFYILSKWILKKLKLTWKQLGKELIINMKEALQ